MAWDFSTEREFQEQLDWMAQFVREEIWPLETLELDQAQLDRALRPLQEQVRARDLWAAHLPPELGGQRWLHPLLAGDLRSAFSTNASVADFLIVMAVTDPGNRPQQRASMIIAATPRSSASTSRRAARPRASASPSCSRW